MSNTQMINLNASGNVPEVILMRVECNHELIIIYLERDFVFNINNTRERSKSSFIFEIICIKKAKVDYATSRSLNTQLQYLYQNSNPNSFIV